MRFKIRWLFWKWASTNANIPLYKIKRAVTSPNKGNGFLESYNAVNRTKRK